MTKRFVDGFVIPIPRKNIAAYKRIAQKAGKIWMEHGALQYCESVGADLNIKFGLPFPKLAKTKPGETIVFAWVVYKSRKHRDSVNKKVMADPRLQMDMKAMPFDLKRMTMGGFDLLVDLE